MDSFSGTYLIRMCIIIEETDCIISFHNYADVDSNCTYASRPSMNTLMGQISWSFLRSS